MVHGLKNLLDQLRASPSHARAALDLTFRGGIARSEWLEATRLLFSPRGGPFLVAARDRFSPDEPIGHYVSRVLAFRRRVRSTMVADLLTAPDLPEHLRALRVRYEGEDHLEAAKASGRPVLAVFWHNSANVEQCFLHRKLPGFVYFGVRERSLGEWKQSAIGKSAQLGLVRMSKLLQKGTPIGINLDGGLGDRSLAIELLGRPGRITRGVPNLIRLANPAVLPVLSVFDPSDPGAVTIHFGANPFQGLDPSQLSDERIAQTLLDQLLATVGKHGPDHFCPAHL